MAGDVFAQVARMSIRQSLGPGPTCLIALVCLLVVTVASRTGVADPETASVLAQSDRASWTIPEGASNEANPIAVTPDLLDAGRELYAENCRRCHGPQGRGDGSDADPDDPPGDLTDPARARRNRDGVVFYKVWNGRSNPKMPAFRDEGLTEEEVWTIVAYVQTLRER